MKKLLPILISTTFISFTSQYACSTSLTEALVHSYNNNSKLQAQRESLKNTDEMMFEAISGFLPNISFEHRNGFNKQNNIGGTEKQWIKREQYSNNLSITQNIFRGGGSLASIESAKHQIEKGRAELKVKEQEVLYESIKAYLDVLKAIKDIEINKKNVHGFKRKYESIKAQFEESVVTKTDLAEAELRLSEAKVFYEDAENAYAAALANYKNIIGIEAENLEAPDPIREIPKNLEEAIALAQKNNPSIISAKEAMLASDYYIKQEASSLLPEVNLQATIGESREKTGDIKNNRVDQKSFLLSVTVPIYNSGINHSKIRKAKNQYSAIKYSARDVFDSIKSETVKAWNSYENFLLQLEHANNAVKAANIALEGRKQEYDEGQVNIAYLLESQSNLYKMEKQYNNAESNSLLAYYNFKKTLGQLDAINLKLPTPIYNPKLHYDNVKIKLIGF